MNSTPAVPQGTEGDSPDSAADDEGRGQVLGVSQEMHSYRLVGKKRERGVLRAWCFSH